MIQFTAALGLLGSIGSLVILIVGAILTKGKARPLLLAALGVSLLSRAVSMAPGLINADLYAWWFGLQTLLGLVITGLLVAAAVVASRGVRSAEPQGFAGSGAPVGAMTPPTPPAPPTQDGPPSWPQY